MDLKERVYKRVGRLEELENYWTMGSCQVPAIASCLLLFLLFEAAASLSELRAADTAAIDFSTVETVYKRRKVKLKGKEGSEETGPQVLADCCMKSARSINRFREKK